MIAIKINNKKEFMSKLLVSDLFNAFLVEEATIDTFNTFHIDGKLHKDFYRNAPDFVEESFTDVLSTWEALKPICFDLIKGKLTPLGFKFILHAGNELKKTIINNADASLDTNDITLGLNIRFSNGDVIVTTGTAFSVFTMDKTIEKAWDNYIPSFLEKSDISTELL